MMCDVRSSMCDVSAHPACPLQRAGAFSWLLMLTLTLLAPVHAQAQAPAPEADPHAELIERFRAAEDDDAIAEAWRAMHDAMTDAEMKAALAGRPTDDGSLRADLTLLAPDLDLMPTGEEGPGVFQWVRLAAEMRRAFEAIPDHRRWDEESGHWHRGYLDSTRNCWYAVGTHDPRDMPNGTALRHIVALGSAGMHPMMGNDGVPFSIHVWDNFTAMRIVDRVLETVDRPRLSDFPEAELSWADRGLVWLIDELVTANWFDAGEDTDNTQAFADMLHRAGQAEIDWGWIGGIVLEPVGWDAFLTQSAMGRFIWEPIESPVNETEDKPASAPDIDWEQWVGTGLCLVRIQRDPPWNWQGSTQELVEQVAVPTLVLIPNHGLHGLPRGAEPVQVGVYLLLPGVRPMAFGTFDLPKENEE